MRHVAEIPPLAIVVGGVAALAWWAIGAWWLRAGVARAFGARPAFGAVLWTVLFGAVVWAMLAVTGLILTHDSALGSGLPFAALAFVLSLLALALGVRLFLPGPDGARLRWTRALAVSLLPALWLWGAALAAARYAAA
ncbi:hypothetical protein K4L06_02535 [Lysobacter sp. BMK333-48F3]|uniref:hypothetical protein n=1 Tax=Lysobacter sp. BMK333-48F3 TaxID=2867962 RepID=UPI001C8B9471|nr:hypothetical protein [Lysobacter sp. BMK333-48F3]MBX9400172.1 hypothetical protein [Lysobacter sp. BMK333-48F3]